MESKYSEKRLSQDQRQRLINRHLGNNRRVSSILTHIKGNSRAIDNPHVKDLACLQQVLNNNFYFQLLKYTKVSEQSLESSRSQIESEEKNRNSHETNEHKQNNLEYVEQKEQQKYSRLLQDVQRQTRKLVLNRIQKDDLTKTLNCCFEKEAKSVRIPNNQEISPLGSFTNLVKYCKSLEASPQNFTKRASVMPKNSRQTRYERLQKKIEAVGSSIRRDFETKIFNTFHKPKRLFNHHNVSTISLSRPTPRNNSLCKSLGRGILPKFLSSAAASERINDSKMLSQATVGLSQQHSACQATVIKQTKPKPQRKMRKGILFGPPKKLPPVKQRDRLIKKIEDFLTFTDNVQNVLQNSNIQLSGLIEEMQDINKDDFDQLKEQQLQIDPKVVEEFRNITFTRKFQK